MSRLIAFLLGLLCLSFTMSLAQEGSTSSNQPIVLRLASSATPNTFDPLFAESAEDFTFINNLFIGLTRVDPQTGDILPALAREWSVSDDGLTWTFVLRDDVYWVRYDVATATFEQVRLITAEDMVYTIQRLCDSPDNGYYAVDVLAKRIAGCADGQNANDGGLAQVAAPDSTTFTITLNAPYGTQNDPYSYFLTMTTLPALRPQPREAIETLGTDWAYPNNILSSGAFVLSRFVPTVGITLLKNPFYPTDLWYGGNIDAIDVMFVPEFRTQFDLYRNALLDMAGVPIGEVSNVKDDETYNGQLVELSELSVFFMGFVTDKPPFDDVYVRRAFSAAIDRRAFVDRVRFGYDTPVDNFIPQGVAHAPENPAIVGYDVDYARQQLALSSYPDCQNFPEVTLVLPRGAGSWGTYVVAQWVNILGCDLARFTVNETSFDELERLVNPLRTPVDARPNIFSMGWSPDYPDADSYASFIECGVSNFFARQCTPVDDLIAQARLVADSAERTRLYTQIEEGLFGVEGEFPLLTLYARKRFVLVQPWLTGAISQTQSVNIPSYDAYTIDVALRGANIRCEVTNNRPAAINRRASASTQANIVGQMSSGETIRAIGQAVGDDNLVWWQLETGEWVRSDVVDEVGQCEALPTTR